MRIAFDLLKGNAGEYEPVALAALNGRPCRHRLWTCDERWYSWNIWFDEDYFKVKGGAGLTR